MIETRRRPRCFRGRLVWIILFSILFMVFGMVVPLSLNPLACDHFLLVQKM